MFQRNKFDGRRENNLSQSFLSPQTRIYRANNLTHNQNLESKFVVQIYLYVQTELKKQNWKKQIYITIEFKKIKIFATLSGYGKYY